MHLGTKIHAPIHALGEKIHAPIHALGNKIHAPSHAPYHTPFYAPFQSESRFFIHTPRLRSVPVWGVSTDAAGVAQGSVVPGSWKSRETEGLI